MFDELVTAYGNRFLVAALGVSLALLCLFIVLWLLRNRAPSPFVRGGRNRQPRLQVLDAAAVDARRRLVLVRRDNVEHLVMIGGPTDIVIESGIGDERAYLSARPVTDAPLQVAADVAPASQPGPATAPRALDRLHTPVAPAAAPEAATAAKDERTQAARPDAPIAARTMTPPASAPAAETAPLPSVIVPKAAPSAAPVAQPTQPQRPSPSNVEMRKPEAPVAEVAPAPMVRPEPARPGLDATESVPSEDPKAEIPVARPLSGALPQPSPVALAKPAAQTAAPVQPAAPAIQAGPVAAPMGTPEPRPLEVSARFAAPAAAAATVPATVGQSMERPSKPTADPNIIPQEDASDILEAARQRVLSPVSAPSRGSEPRPDRPSSTPETPVRSGEQSEFERVLEEEMALHLAANDARSTASPPFQPILPETRADRPFVPPIAGPVVNDASRPGVPAKQEPDLQDEIARIFGEMSADRH
ncbi:MAG: flagellar biosynthetic protein FliO [Rhizobium sp.]|nr:flagellar biosynthetic protein FliO [Rhizobium sp.]